MDSEHARTLLSAQRTDVQRLLGEVGTEQGDDHEAEAETGDAVDPAQPLESQGVDDAVAAGLREKLAAIDRALDRIDDGTYGVSIRSGAVIPDARLEADPTAELTVDEAAADEAAQR